MPLVDQPDLGDFQRVAQDRQARSLVLGHRPAEEVHVQPLDVPRQVGDRDVLEPVHLQGDVGVAQGQVEVDQGDGVVPGRRPASRRGSPPGWSCRPRRGSRGRRSSSTRRSGAIERPGRLAACSPCSPSAAAGRRACLPAPTGWVRKYLAPFWSDCSRAWWSWLMVRIGSFGCSTESWPIIWRALLLVGVEGDDGQVRQRLLDDVEEVLVAGTLGLEPDEVHAQQQRAERFAGRFGRVYDRDTLHGHHRSCRGRIARGSSGPPVGVLLFQGLRRSLRGRPARPRATSGPARVTTSVARTGGTTIAGGRELGSRRTPGPVIRRGARAGTIAGSRRAPGRPAPGVVRTRPTTGTSRRTRCTRCRRTGRSPPSGHTCRRRCSTGRSTPSAAHAGPQECFPRIVHNRRGCGFRARQSLRNLVAVHRAHQPRGHQDHQFALPRLSWLTRLNTVPTNGRSPRTGTFRAAAVTLFWISPPMANVWPDSSMTAVRTVCSSKPGVEVAADGDRQGPG